MSAWDVFWMVVIGLLWGGSLVAAMVHEYRGREYERWKRHLKYQGRSLKNPPAGWADGERKAPRRDPWD